MKLTIKTLNAKVQQTFVLDVELDYEISYVKFLLQDRTNIPFDHQALLDDGQVLRDSLRLVDCDFIGDRTIHLLLIDEYLSKSLAIGDPFKVTVMYLNGKNIELEIKPEDQVEDLKVKVKKKEGIPVDQQRLIFDGKQLQDSQVLTALGVRRGSVIHLVLRLGGSPVPRYNLQFRTLTGKTITMTGENKTVKMAIEQVWKVEGIRAGNELIFNNEPLDNEKLMVTAGQCYLDYFPNAHKFEEDSILEFRNKPSTRANGELKVYVKFPESENRKALALSAGASDSVRSLRSAIESEASCKSGFYLKLKLAGEDRELEDDRKLSDYAVRNETVLCATLKMKLFVRSLDHGAIFRLDVHSGDRIENIKKRIQRQERIPTDVQVLSFGTRRLEDDELVEVVCFKGKPVLGLEVKSVRNLQIRISSFPWAPKLGTHGIDGPTSLSIKSNETIGRVKSRIATNVNRLPDQQHLYFNGEQLVDSCTLDQLGLQNRVGLSLACRSNAFKISITPIGTSLGKFEVEADSHDTIKYVKSKIEQRMVRCSYCRNRSDFPSERQVLTHEGKPLEDDRTLQNYRIGAGSELSVSLRVVELEVSVQTESVEKRVLKVRSDCTWEMFVSEIKKLGLSICSDNDCYAPRYHNKCGARHLSQLIVREPVMIEQTAHCNECPGCAKIKEFKQVTA